MAMALGGPAAGCVRLEDVEGCIFDLQRYSLHDGPGLRTNVFFKGCPLHCRWCSNPESQAAEPELAFFATRCFGCGDCLAVCATGGFRLKEGTVQWEPSRCDGCGRCVAVCASEAMRWIGRTVRAGEVLAEALRDAAFYQGQGGVTLTGGEPLLQPAFALAILQLARRELLHTTLETCGYAPWSVLETMLPHLDLVLYDIKHLDTDVHREATGTGNELILDNARRLARSGVGTIIRVPLVPGYNTGPNDIRRTAEFVVAQGLEQVHLLPYHRLGRPKYVALGRQYQAAEVELPSDEEVEAIASVMRSYGLRVQVGG